LCRLADQLFESLDIAAAMGIEPLTEEQYRELQKLANFDTKRRAG
jgi:hypothetical protein